MGKKATEKTAYESCNFCHRERASHRTTFVALIPFPMKGILLSTLMIILFSCTNHSQQQRGVQLVSVQAFAEALKATPNATIIDVRTPEEFQGGHLEDAVNFNVLGPDFQAQVSKLDKTQPVFVYCKVGGRSADAVEKMKSMGFTTIYDMKGGYMAWSSAGMESTKAACLLAALQQMIAWSCQAISWRQ